MKLSPNLIKYTSSDSVLTVYMGERSLIEKFRYIEFSHIIPGSNGIYRMNKLFPSISNIIEKTQEGDFIKNMTYDKCVIRIMNRIMLENLLSKSNISKSKKYFYDFDYLYYQFSKIVGNKLAVKISYYVIKNELEYIVCDVNNNYVIIPKIKNSAKLTAETTKKT